jgi:two-component system CheB/CheR fusion protein
VLIFHYALRPGRFLLWGNAESIDGFHSLFAAVDEQNTIYARMAGAAPVDFEFPAGAYAEKDEPGRRMESAGRDLPAALRMQRQADGILLAKYTPAGAVINDNLEIVQFRGHTSPYLQPGAGLASFNILKMAAEGLRGELRSTIHAARREDTAVRREGVCVPIDGAFRTLNLEVIPVKAATSSERCYLVLFEEAAAAPSSPAASAKPQGAAGEAEQLRQELDAVREYLQTSLEAQEVANEELKSVNEEILSSNEEMQSTNEELETAQEELQSANEELTTLNGELESRNDELSRINADLNNLLANVSIPVVMLGRDLRIRRFTPIAERIFNLLPADVGRPLTDIMPRIDVPDLHRQLLEVLETLASKELEVRDREGRWYIMRLRPYRVENTIDGVVLTFFDIDALKHSLREQLAREQAEAANRAKDDFLATLSHELRTPLNAILGWTTLLRSGKLDAEMAARGLSIIERNVKAQARLIEDLLDIPRMSAGKIKLDVCPLDLRGLVQLACDTARPGAEAKGVHLGCDVGPSPIQVAGDPGRLQQVVGNLLSNAIKFTPSGGRIEVRLESGAEQAVLIVRDTGQGIHPDFMPHLFERFRQADTSATRSHGGLGLGLAITRNLVEMHGGTIRAESPSVGQGTTFTVTLPLSRAPIDDGAASPASAEVDLRGVRVLVVEDEADMRNVLMMGLQESGAEVRTAGSTAEALAAIRSWRPNVLVSDIAMPGEDGYELLRRLRAFDAAHGVRTPVLAVTAYARKEDRQRAAEAGFDDYLTKPVESAPLCARVARLARAEEQCSPDGS